MQSQIKESISFINDFFNTLSGLFSDMECILKFASYTGSCQI